MTADYKNTVFLPRSDFPMRANLPQREPDLLARWAAQDLYGQQRRQAAGRKKFVLHDGPPYANGHLHIGHALNKILKDVINRSQQMLGHDADYVPGWDCHGLPIEWKIEEKYRAEGRDKDDVPILDFRQECRDFAEHWIAVQSEEFQRLGVTGDWQRPYTTMTRAAEAQIVRELGKFLVNGGLYKGAKPVMWSPVEKTALAEAEIEYHDHRSTTVYVRFPVLSGPPELADADVVIWTTTPWTLPGNRAVAYGASLDYLGITVSRVAEGSLAVPGQRLLFAAGLLESACADIGIAEHAVFWRGTGADLAGVVCGHPLRGQGYEFAVPAHAGDFVTTEQGTGFVHIAPGHGADDWELGMRHGIAVPETVDGDGLFMAHVPLFAGQHVYKAHDAVAGALQDAGFLLARGELVHSYPHSWRSKAPLIFRNTPQWFISMDINDLRDKALAAIDETRWVPASGRNRLHAMIESRPDWCVSRQRAWGVPITAFVDTRTGEPLRDPAVVERIAQAVEKDGADVWFDGDPRRFLGDEYDPAYFEPVYDILDVWFESGTTHSFVLEPRNDLKWPASLYLEGSDQHRGWFHSSLLESCGTRGRAPYEAVLTHGFVLDEQGRKMSKSLGNVVAPQEVVDKFGADVLRLWVVGQDYSEDLRIGSEILKGQVDLYRRIRNTLRYLIGNLDGFTEAERLPAAEMPELDRWVLHRLRQLDEEVRRCCDDFDFTAMFTALHHFCAIDLSAFYFDIRKDSLYCDAPTATRRRAVRTVLDAVFERLTAWLAPVLCFTAEEAWLARFPDGGSVHLRTYPDTPGEWQDDALAEKWFQVREVRRVITGALEVERAEKRIGSSLQAHPTVYLPADRLVALDGLDMAEIAITSGIDFVTADPPDGAFTMEGIAGIGVVVRTADGVKCARCWRVLPDVGADSRHPEACGRCAEAVETIAATDG
jgi:isoleucyl-tRNA synthetase